MAERPFIYRFTNDLRLDDHAGLASAASRGAVIPLLVLDEELTAHLIASPRRAGFFCGAVAALNGELRERGSRLIVRRGSPARAIAALARETGAAGAAWSASYDLQGMQRDRALQSELEEAQMAAAIVHDAPAIAPEESSAARSSGARGYRAFAPYFDVWCELPITTHESPLLLHFADAEVADEPLPSPQEFGAVEPSSVGSLAARRSFERFLRHAAGEYAGGATDLSEDRTSHLSADLSFGTISARTVVRSVRERIGDPFALGEERVSLRLFLRAYAHRDFFLQLSWFHPQTQDDALQEKMRAFPFAHSHPQLESWREGATGYPLVDAGIRQLHATGWMHPHVRAVAASWLCFDLGVDWRVGRAEWDRWLIEDDPALATGNWQWIAGVGADMAQYPRIYNPERQRRRYDHAGLYVRHWIPELENVPLEAWGGRPEALQLGLGLYPGESYPKPVVDHAIAARAFLRRYREFTSP
jgi:deoxyribodipyrimidine photo-lyase